MFIYAIFIILNIIKTNSCSVYLEDITQSSSTKPQFAIVDNENSRFNDSIAEAEAHPKNTRNAEIFADSFRAKLSPNSDLQIPPTFNRRISESVPHLDFYPATTAEASENIGTLKIRKCPGLDNSNQTLQLLLKS